MSMMRVMKAGPILLLASLCAGIGAAAMAAESAPGSSRLSVDKLFIDKVKPLLDSRCVSCHGPDKVKGGLRLDSREAALKPGESGLPAVVPGKPDQSLLLQAVMHSKKELEMPPKEKLTSNDVAVLERWIREGAPWPKGEIIPVTAADARTAPG